MNDDCGTSTGEPRASKVKLSTEQKKERARAYAAKWRSKNKEKANAAVADWYRRNKEKATKRVVAWQRKNREELNARQRAFRNSEEGKKRESVYRERQRTNRARLAREWLADHVKGPKMREAARKRAQQRRKTDVAFRIKTNLRSRIYAMLKKQGGVKTERTIKYLGCDIETLRRHLESQFQRGMNWKNQGFYGWHIDHVVPCAAFDLTKDEEVMKCFHFSNLRPLWATANKSKNAKIITCQPELPLAMA